MQHAATPEVNSYRPYIKYFYATKVMVRRVILETRGFLDGILKKHF